MTKKIKYLMNWFPFQFHSFKKYVQYDFSYIGPNKMTNYYKWEKIKIWKTYYKKLNWILYIILNYFLIRRLYKKWEIKNYDIIHFNNTENFLNFKPLNNQISVAESHWFDIWVNFERFLSSEKRLYIKVIWKIVDKILWWLIRKKINQFDIYYCSTLDMLEVLKEKVRKDTKWLPNPVDVNIFKPEWKIIKLSWNPACFLPNRLHWNKNPKVALDIFQKYIKPNFPNATLHLLDEWCERFKYKDILKDEKTYFWHSFMDKETLAWKIRWSDLCFWDFELWALTLLDMQVMACKKPIVTYDNFEIIKIKPDKLLDLTRDILENKEKCEMFIEKNYKYIYDFHTEESISKIHLNNLKPFMDKIKQKN